MKEIYIAALKVGDKVWIAQSYSWGSLRYRPGTIIKITPTGLVDVAPEGGIISTRFDKQGNERGNRYRGEWIDTTMTFEERRLQIEMEARALLAKEAIDKVERTQMNTFDKKLLLEEVNRLQTLLDEARKLTEAI